MNAEQKYENIRTKTAIIATILAIVVLMSPVILNARVMAFEGEVRSKCSCFLPAGSSPLCHELYCEEGVEESVHGLCGALEGYCDEGRDLVINPCDDFNWQYYCSKWIM